MMLLELLAIGCVVLATISIHLYLSVKELSKQLEDEKKANAEVAERPPSVELDEFLHDMTAYGKGMVIVTRAPVEGTLIRSFNAAK